MKTVLLRSKNGFFNLYHETVSLTVDPHKPRIFKVKNANMINTFAGFRWTEKKTRKDFSKEVLSKVETIWAHAEKVLCSGNQKTFKYLKNYLCKKVTGFKMRTALSTRWSENRKKHFH
jgi:hypothetical protein